MSRPVITTAAISVPLCVSIAFFIGCNIRIVHVIKLYKEFHIGVTYAICIQKGASSYPSKG